MKKAVESIVNPISNRGLFITFEGPDGAGKTTQLHLLSRYLVEEKNLDVVVTREPGGTAISDRIREILLNPELDEMMAETEILLYAASRAQHVREKILPALSRGQIVLCDRFVDASVAYQGYGGGISIAKIQKVNTFATGGLTPDRTYLLDLPEEIGRERILKRQRATNIDSSMVLDRIEQKELAYHKRVRRGFQEIARDASQRIVKIDANQSEQDIHDLIKKDILSLLNETNKES